MDIVTLQWLWKIPLPIVWQLLAEPDELMHLEANAYAVSLNTPPAAGRRAAAMSFWIAKSNEDAWTFDQIRDLIATLRDGSIPDALVEWSLDVTSGIRKRPTRRGPKSDTEKDCRIAWTFRMLVRLGYSGRAAKRRMSEHMAMAPETIENAVRRAENVLKFTWKC